MRNDDYNSEEEEEEDEDLAEYRYDRKKSSHAQLLDIDQLVIKSSSSPPDGSSSMQHPASQAHPSDTSSFPEAFTRELAEIEKMEGIILKPYSNGVEILIHYQQPGALFEPPYAISFLVEVDGTYPSSPMKIYTRPPGRNRFDENLHTLQRYIDSVLVKKATPLCITAAVRGVYEWIKNAALRKQLADDEVAEIEAAAEEARRRDAQLAAEKEAAEDAAWEAKWARRIALRTATWREPTSSELASQPLRSTIPLLCKELAPLALPRTYAGSAVRIQGKVFYFGGVDEDGNCTNVLTVLHIASRRVERFTGEEEPAFPDPSRERRSGPPPLCAHAAAAVGQRMLIFGGSLTRPAPFYTPCSRIWELDTVSMSWQSFPSTFDLIHATATTIDDNTVMLFAGSGLTTCSNDLMCYDVDSHVLKLFNPMSQRRPPARCGHSTIFWQNKLIVFGGKGFEFLLDVWVFDCKERVWKGPLITTGEGGFARTHHTACLVGASMVVFGGESVSETPLADVLVFDICKNQFYLQTISTHIDARTQHTMVLSGGTLLISGGRKNVQRNYISRVQPSIRYTETDVSTTSPPPIAVAIAPVSVNVSASHFLDQLANGRGADLMLGPAKLPVHSFMIYCRCPALTPKVLLALAAGPDKATPLEIPNVHDQDSYKKLCNYIYTGNPASDPAEESYTLHSLFEENETSELLLIATELELPLFEARVRKRPEVSHTSEVLVDLARLAAEPRHADFTLVCGELRLGAYRSLLSIRSEYFRMMLGSGMKEAQAGEMQLPEMHPSAAKAMHRFLFTDELDASCCEHVLDLLPFAHVAGLSRLQHLVEQLVIDAYDLTDLDSVLSLVSIAHHHQNQALLSRCVLLITQQFTLKVAMQSPVWSTLSPDLQSKLQKLAM